MKRKESPEDKEWQELIKVQNKETRWEDIKKWQQKAIERIIKYFEWEKCSTAYSIFASSFHKEEPPSINKHKLHARKMLIEICNDINQENDGQIKMCSWPFEAVTDKYRIELKLVITFLEEYTPYQKKHESDLYPFYWNGKHWNKKDVDEIFDNYYVTPDQVFCGAYLSDGVRIFPDGSMIDENN